MPVEVLSDGNRLKQLIKEHKTYSFRFYMQV